MVDNVEGCNRVVSVLSEIVETTKVGSEAREQVITGSAWGGWCGAASFAECLPATNHA